MLELEQYTQDLAAVRKSILAAGEALHIDHMKEQIDELTEEMNQPEFWNDPDHSTRVNQKLGHLKNRLSHYESLLSQAEDIDTMMELAREENDEDMVAEVGEALAHLKEQADALELETLMRGDYDDSDAVLSLHAGAGGTEAQDWTQMLYRMYTRYCEQMGFQVKLLDLLEGDEAGIKSVSFEVSGITPTGISGARRACTGWCASLRSTPTPGGIPPSPPWTWRPCWRTTRRSRST